MPIVRVTRRLHFSAGHRLHNPNLSDEENREVYGLCNNPSGHGHNYGLEVTVRGEVDPRTGYVFDLKRLKKTVEEVVLEDVDHANLNADVPWLEGVIPTAENIAVQIWCRLADVLPSGMLERVVVSESERNLVEYRGDEGSR
jgi:6-pyruvoyltetrahydropterin/6-carboxytetrahydropterin synthase